MSFSHKVKDELAGVIPGARHCQIAEIAAIISMAGNVYTGKNGRHAIKVQADRFAVVSKCQQLIKKAFSYIPECSVRKNRETGNTVYMMCVTDSDTAVRILLAAKLMDVDGSINRDFALVSVMGISSACCKRAYLRGAFLAGGSLSDPEKSYHFEIVASGQTRAGQIAEAMRFFELDARIVERRRSFVVYLKEGEQIVDMLNVMGARVSLMDLENVRVVKEVRNSLNRKLNCEVANLGKTINAAVKQIEDIRYISDTIGLNSLNEDLEMIARLRVQYTDAPLKDLGMMLPTPLGKSGVNHRLRKISMIAESLREKNGQGPGGMKNDNKEYEN